MKLSNPFVLNNLPDDSNDYLPLPDGNYQVSIEACEVKQTKSGQGQYLNFKFKVLGPSHQGRILWDIVNIHNPSQKAEEIGHITLKKIMSACGLGHVDDTDMFIGKMLEVGITTEKREGFDPRNKIKKYKALDGGFKQPEPQAAQLPPQPTATPPWMK